MIKLLVLAVALTTVGAQASEKVSATEICASHAKLAKSIMKSRQTGVEMASLLSAIDGLPDDSNKSLTEAMILMAYGESKYATPDNQNSAITEFSNKIMHLCMTKAKNKLV